MQWHFDLSHCVATVLPPCTAVLKLAGAIYKQLQLSLLTSIRKSCFKSNTRKSFPLIPEFL